MTFPKSLFAAALLIALAQPALAETDTTQKADTDATKPATGLWDRDTLTGDWNGYRTKLSDMGIALGGTLILDAQGNPTGGVNRGGVVQGRLELDLDTDFEKLAHIKGLTSHISAYSIFGRGLGASDINNLMAPSNIEAQRASFRLFDAWLQYEAFDGDASLRLGQLAADDEFAISEYGGLFVNASFGWPAALAADLPSGGPAYPYATPGARLRLGQNKPWSVQAAVFNGDPTGAGHAPGTPQERDPSGTRFGFSDDALFMLEGAYAVNGDEKATGLPGTYKLGLWTHTGNFADPREDTAGGALANPGGTGIAKNRDSNYGVYAVADQMVWHMANDREHGVALFARGFLQPGDRNLASFQGDIGVNVKGMLFGRKDDTLGLGFSYLKISDRQRGFDEDNNVFTAVNGPLEDHESVLEVTYQAQLAPWLILQPDFQYVFHPGGNVADPTDASGLTAIPDAAIFALRTVIKF